MIAIQDKRKIKEQENEIPIASKLSIRTATWKNERLREAGGEEGPGINGLSLCDQKRAE